MNICFCLDHNHAPYFLNVVNSIIKNADSNRRKELKFIFLLESESTRKSVVDVMNKFIELGVGFETRVLLPEHAKYIIKNMRVDDEYSKPQIQNVMNFARIYIPLYFDVESYLYLDVDTIVKANIFNINNEIAESNTALWAVRNDSIEFYIKGEKVKKRSINGGVYYVNVKSWIDLDATKKCEDLMKKNKNSRIPLYTLGTQPMLELVFGNGVGELDERWNVYHLGWKENISETKIENAFILHWNGAMKGWRSDGYYKYYWDQYSKCNTKQFIKQ